MADENLPRHMAPLIIPASAPPLHPPSPSLDPPTSPSLPPPPLSSLSQSPVFKSLNHGARGCVTCGHGADGRLLHRLKHDGAVRHHCSSCILFYNKGMYCSQCFQVYRDATQLGDPALWLTCRKCLRLSHLGCVRKRVSPSGPLDYSFFTCQDCCDPSIRGAEPRVSHTCVSNSAEGRETPSMALSEGPSPPRDVPTSGDVEQNSDLANPADFYGRIAPGSLPEPAGSAFQDLSIQDQEALAAANIVAALAANEAKEAKTRARATAAAAVKAASRAKAALDAAYRAAREEVRLKVEASRNLPAIAGQPTAQITEGIQTVGASILEKRKLEAVVESADLFVQTAKTPSNPEDLDRSLTSFPNAPRSPRTGGASHKRRTLSAIAASEATRAHPNSFAGSQHGAALLTPQRPKSGSLVDLGSRGSFVSTEEVADQIHENIERGLKAGPVVLADVLEVSASPASILESFTLLGTPRAEAVASISETNTGEKFSCSSLLPENDGHGNSQASISRNGLVVTGEDLAADGSKLLPCLITDSPVIGICKVDGEPTNQSDNEGLQVFSRGSDEAVTDDLVDLAALLPGGCDREAKLSTGCVSVEVNPASLGISADNALLIETSSAALQNPQPLSGSNLAG